MGAEPTRYEPEAWHLTTTAWRPVKDRPVRKVASEYRLRGERKAGKSNFTVIRLTRPESFISLKNSIASKPSAHSPGVTTLYPLPSQRVAFLLQQEFPNPVISWTGSGSEEVLLRLAFPTLSFPCVSSYTSKGLSAPLDDFASILCEFHN